MNKLIKLLVLVAVIGGIATLVMQAVRDVEMEPEVLRYEFPHEHTEVSDKLPVEMLQYEFPTGVEGGYLWSRTYQPEISDAVKLTAALKGEINAGKVTVVILYEDSKGDTLQKETRVFKAHDTIDETFEFSEQGYDNRINFAVYYDDDTVGNFTITCTEYVKKYKELFQKWFN